MDERRTKYVRVSISPEFEFEVGEVEKANGETHVYEELEVSQSLPSIVDAAGVNQATKLMTTISATDKLTNRLELIKTTLNASHGDAEAISDLGKYLDEVAMARVFPVYSIDRADVVTADRLKEICLWYRRE